MTIRPSSPRPARETLSGQILPPTEAIPLAVGLDAELRRGAILTGLDRAMTQNLLHLAFQPVFPTCDRRAPSGAEALLRWTDPVLGPIGPNEFIPLFEAGGLIRRLDMWVLDRVLDQLVSWRSQRPSFPIYVNISSSTLEDPDLPAFLSRAIQERNLPGAAIWLELTEWRPVRALDSARDVMRQLYAQGIFVALDDFGTAHSELSYLVDLPVKAVKIDRLFIGGLHSADGRSRVVTEGILKMAKALDLQTVAEGVETEEQIAWLLERGCDRVQGVGLCAPLSVEEFAKRYLF